LATQFERLSSEAILQCLPAAVLLLDGDLRVVLANRAAGALFRLPPERVRGVLISSLVPYPALAAWLREFGVRRTKMIEITLPAKGQGRAPRTLKITALRMAATTRTRRATRAPREFRLLLMEDITGQAALESQIVETEKQAAMGQLAAGLLHEVRNPVASLGSNLLFVHDKLARDADAEVVQALAVSLDQLDQMRQLLGTLSGFPRTPAPDYTRADLHALVLESLTFIAREAERRGIQLMATFAPYAIDCEIDVRMIKQVLLNLLMNAMEAMPAGGRLDVRTWSRAESGAEVPAAVIEVADTGVGISEADLRMVFRPLFTTKPRGAGLGLSFCRQAVEGHGGEIRLASRGTTRGTVATVSLPLFQRASE
jgi:signal transduction histidine kinase